MNRRRSSFLEDVVDLVAMLPWWAGILLAILAYVWLHQYAIAEIPRPDGLQNATATATAPLIKMLASLGQYFLPFLLLLGAGLSFFKRKQRKELLAYTAASSASNSLENMSWREFELLVSEVFRQQGFSVLETGGRGADGGIDLVIKKDTDRYLVQCKQWKAYKVGVVIVRELYGVMAAEGAAGGFVVTSGVFTRDAEEFAAGRNITLVNGTALRRMISKVEPSAMTQDQKNETALGSPICPLCNEGMVKRIAKRGANAGSAFWGCSAYPKCRGTLQIDE